MRPMGCRMGYGTWGWQPQLEQAPWQPPFGAWT